MPLTSGVERPFEMLPWWERDQPLSTEMVRPQEYFALRQKLRQGKFSNVLPGVLRSPCHVAFLSHLLLPSPGSPGFQCIKHVRRLTPQPNTSWPSVPSMFLLKLPLYQECLSLHQECSPFPLFLSEKLLLTLSTSLSVSPPIKNLSSNVFILPDLPPLCSDNFNHATFKHLSHYIIANYLPSFT